MVVLDYVLSPEWNRRADSIDLRSAQEMTLRYDCFLGDVVLVVGDLDLSARWGWVPVFDFALGLRAIAGALAAEDEQVFEFTESDATIEFRRRGSGIAISSSYSDGAVEGRARRPLSPGRAVLGACRRQSRQSASGAG